MAEKRKKTLAELMQERLQGSTNTSAYTTEPMKTSNNSVKSIVNNVYQKNNTINNTSNSTWDRVLSKANQFLNDTGNVLSNLGLGIKKAGESSLYYIENISSNKNKEYQNKIWKKDRQKQIQNKILEANSNNQNKEINLISTKDLKLQGSTTNPLLYKSELLQNYENPILRDKKEKIEEDEAKIQENIKNTDGAIMKKIAELSPSIGQSVAGMGASVINPGLGIAFWQTSAGGDYTRDAKARGMNDDDALLYGTIMGGMESATEWIGGELTKGVGKAFTKDGVIKGLKALGLDIGENFFEEAIMEPLQETIATMTGGKETADWSNMAKRMLQSGIDGALTSILIGGASAGIGKATNIISKFQKGETVSQNEIKEALKEINSKEELDIERILVNNFGFNSQDLYKNTTVQQNIENKINNISSELSQNEIKGILPQKRPATIENSRLLNNNQQTIQNKQQIPQNQTSQQLQQNSEYLIKMPNSNFKFEASGNQKIDNLRQDASKYWNNSNATKNLVTNIEKIISDKDYSIRLDNSITDTKGNFVNGKITKENGGTIITLNPNTNRAFEFLIGHEVGHAITTPEMKKLVIDFANKNSEFSNAIESLKQNYDVNEITDEVVSDIEGQLLGNQEFINSLSIEKPNIFKQIYDAIISIANKITGNSNEALFIRDLKNKYQKAYRETRGSNVEEGETSYSIAGINAVKNIKDNKKFYQQAINNYNLAKNMAKQGKNNVEIMKKTGWFKDDTGKFKFSFSDKDMNLKNIKFKENTIYKLEEILDHDTLFMFYPELKNYKVEFKDLNKNRKNNESRLNGSFSRKDKGIRLDIYRANSKIDTEGTLIHEIQHAIQNIEGFTRGTSIKAGKKQYQRSLGEREARDTANRFINEKYNRIDMSNILPESATFDRNILDKMKDALYNYFNKLSQGVSNEEIIETNKEVADRNRVLVDGRITENQELEKSSSFSMPKDNAQYSKENPEWQEYLEKSFKSEGTRTFKEELIGLPKETDMPESTEVKLNKLKKESEDLKQRRNTIENIDIFEISSEDWQKQIEELNKITDRETVLNSKIEELENIPDTLNNIVRNRKAKKSLLEKTNETNTKFQKAFVNKYYEIDKLANKTNNKNLSIALDNWIGSMQQVETTIDGNTKYGTGQTNNKGEVIGESVTQILKDVYKKKDIINLTDYMQNKLNIERSKHKKANLDVTPEQSQAIVERYEKQKPYLKEVANKLYKFYDNILQNCVDAGLGTNELKNAVREMYPSYMPIYKNISELRSFIDNGEINNKMIKKAVGGQTDILAIDVASAEYAMGMNRKIQLNNLLVELKNSLEKSHQLEDYVNTEQPSDLEDFASDKPKKVNEMIMQTVDGNNIATCYIDGIAHQFKISDEIYNLLKSQDIKETKFGEEIISSANNLYRKMVTTYNPAFTLKNMVKDFFNGCYNTKYGALTYVKNYLKGIKEIILNGEYSKLYRNAGLQGNSKYSKTKGILTDNSLNAFQKYNPISLGNNIIDFVNTNIESMGRMSEFISALESGKDINEARYEASEVTLNFKRGGEASKTITKWVSPFFNSSILAVEKTIKNVTGKNGKKGLANFIVMGLVSGVGFSMLNHLIYKDDEEYEELPDYIKDGYWLIKKNDGSGTFHRIAKDQITTAIGSSARRIYQMAQGEEDIGELEDMFKAIFENIGIENPVTSNIYAPIAQALSGKTWYEGDLISDYQKTLSPELQYDYRTNEISKWTANQISKLPEGAKSTIKGLPGAKQVYDILSSPKKSNYVLQQYLGGIGKILIPMATPYAEQNYIEKEMTTNSVFKSKYPSMVYDEFDKAETEFNSYGTNQDKYLYLTEGKKQLSDFYAQIREVENDSTLNSNQKREKEYQIRKELNTTAKEIINNIKNTHKGTSVSKIGDKEYYKNNEGKWKKIDEEDIVEGLSTETYATYRNELTKANSKKKSEYEKQQKSKLPVSEEDTVKSKTLNTSEKISLIQSEKYTDEEKELIYSNYINKDDTMYQDLKKLTNEININQYLDYKSSEFKADDDSNSNIVGKTVSGSKKTKLINYINNSDFSTIEKLYIYGRQYELTEQQKQQFLKYVDKAELKGKEKADLLKKMKGTTVYKNGKITW